MKLVGMLDSPYVRRVAVSLELYGVDFVHEPLSVFSTYAEFAQINPVVKAPTLVLDDGTVLMDSSLILDYLEALAPADKNRLHAPATCNCLGSRWRPVKKACRSSMNTTFAPLKNCMRRGLSALPGNCWRLMRCWTSSWQAMKR